MLSTPFLRFLAAAGNNTLNTPVPPGMHATFKRYGRTARQTFTEGSFCAISKPYSVTSEGSKPCAYQNHL